MSEITILPQPQPFAIPASYGSPGAQGPAGTLATSGLSFHTPQQYGAVADGVTDDSAAFVAAIAALKAYALNNGGSGFYKGSPKLYIPAGNYYLGTTTLDINHTLVIEGEGSGRAPAPAYGCTHLRWANGCDGIRTQAPNTSGTITVDGSTHDGSAGVYISNMTLEGGFTGTEGEYHGIRARSGIYLTDVLIRNWSGDGVHMWTGNVTGNSPPNYAGNVSLARLIGVKSEGNRIAFDIRGTDSNVVTLINCESYQCRLAGIIDDNGAGTNTYMGHHAASNGLITGAWAQTQCSYSGNHYALKWGGDPTVAPSGDTTDTANWFYIEAGAAITNLIPAWVNTPGTFRAGGDYLTINSASSYLVNCYSEYGSFSQFTASTRIDEGTIGDQYFRGGTRIISGSSGFRIRQTPNAALTLQHHSTEGDLLIQDEANVVHSRVLFSKSFGNFYGARDVSGHVFQTAPYNGAWTTIATIDPTGLRVVSGQLGYGTGVGGTVTQATNKSTATPAINKVCGQVTMNGAALAGGAKVSFVVTNSTVAATDTVIVSIASGGTANAYRAAVTAISAGVGFTVTVENITGGSLSEAPVINFAILKAVAA